MKSTTTRRQFIQTLSMGAGALALPNMLFRPVKKQLGIALVGLGYYSTDLGNSLDTFSKRFMDAIDHRTTVIVLGDGRNNYNDPRTDLLEEIKRRSRRIIWLNPEPPTMWGAGDSDMIRYLPLLDSVFEAGNLAQLTYAVDRLLSS